MEPNGDQQILEELAEVERLNRVGFRKDLNSLLDDQRVIGEDFNRAVRRLLEEHFPGRFYQV